MADIRNMTGKEIFDIMHPGANFRERQIEIAKQLVINLENIHEQCNILESLSKQLLGWASMQDVPDKVLEEMRKAMNDSFDKIHELVKKDSNG